MRIIILAALLPLAAFATSPTKVPPPTEQHQSQSQGQQQGQSQESSADNAVTISDRDKLQAPSMPAPAVYASHSCALGWSIGAAGPGAGISGGKAKADPSCERREWYRVLQPEHAELALLIACSDPTIAALVKDRPDLCVYQKLVEERPARPPVTRDDLETLRKDLSESIQRAFSQQQAK